MIVLTDGKANPVGPEAAVSEARAAQRDGVTMFAIGLGAPGDLDDEALRLIASRPAYYYRTPNADDLRAIYAEIAQALPCPAGRYWPMRR